jgi:hypothetical protein
VAPPEKRNRKPKPEISKPTPEENKTPHLHDAHVSVSSKLSGGILGPFCERKKRFSEEGGGTRHNLMDKLFSESF